MPGIYVLTDTGLTPAIGAAGQDGVDGTGAVDSVNGQTGTVVLDKDDVGLGNVDNTTDAGKPVSTATQTALNGKANTSHNHAAADVTSGTFPVGRLGTGTPAAGKYVDGGTGAWTTLPSGGGGDGGETDWRYEPYSNRIADLNIAREDRQAGTWDYTGNSGAITSGIIYNSSGAQNDAIAFPLWLAAGTYRLDVLASTQNNRAIATWEIDDGAGSYSALGTQDWYAASGTAAYNVCKSITGIVLTGSVARRKLRVKAATRNGSATGWFLGLQVVSLVRTA